MGYKDMEIEQMIIDSLEQGHWGEAIAGTFLLIIAAFPLKKVYSSYRASSDLGIVTPTKRIIDVLARIVMSLIIVNVAALILGKSLPRFILGNEILLLMTIVDWYLLLCVMIYVVTLRSIGVKIKRDSFAIGYGVHFSLMIAMAVLLYGRYMYKSMVKEYICCVILLVVISECLNFFEIMERNREYTYYMRDSKRCYLHKISNKEVVCSYNRCLDRRNGYTIEKITDIKNHKLYQECEDTAYSYFKDVLQQNKVKVFEYKEIIDADLSEIENQVGIPQLSTSSEIPQFYWGVVFVVKAKKRKLIEEKMQKSDMKYYNNNGWLWIDTENKKRSILLLYYQKNRPTRKISTNKLDVFLEHVASYFEYSPREECV